jgi:hypothetical protein
VTGAVFSGRLAETLVFSDLILRSLISSRVGSDVVRPRRAFMVTLPVFPARPDGRKP